MGVRTLDPVTGEVRDTPAAEAEAQFRAGKRQLPGDAAVPMADAEGNFHGYIDAAKVPEALNSGVLRFADAGVIAKHEAEEAPVQSFLEGFANNVALPGMYDIPAIAAGADPAALKARADTTAHTLGSVLGFGTGFVLSGGVGKAALSGVAKVTTNRLMPHMLAETAAKATTQAAEKALAGVIENEAARHVVAAGLGHAVVGGGIGALGVLDEAALGNIEASTETILTGIGAGNLIGGVLGGGFAKLGMRGKVDGRVTAGGAVAAREAELPGQLTANELASALEASGQEVDRAGVTKWFPRLMAKMSSKATGVDEADVNRVFSPAGQKVVLQGERAREEAVRSIASLKDRLDENAGRFNLDEARLSDSVLGKIPAMSGDGAVSEASNILGDARRSLKDLVKAAPNYGLTEQQMMARIKPMQDRIRMAEKRIVSHVGAPADIVAGPKRAMAAAADDVFADGMKSFRDHLMAGEVDDGSELALGTSRLLSDLQLPKEARKFGLPSNIPDARVNRVGDVADEILAHWNARAAKMADLPKGSAVALPMTKGDLIAELGKAAGKRVNGGAMSGGEAAAVRAAGVKMADSAKLPKLGAGFARAVFEDTDGTALKVAKKASGIAQNRAEVELSSRSPVLNKVVEYAPDYSWVKQAKVQGFDLGDEAKMAQHLGLETNDPNWLRKMVDGKWNEPLTPAGEAFEGRLRQVLSDVPELDARDIGKASQWGINPQGELVLLDYGYELKGAARKALTEELAEPAVDRIAKSAVPVSDKAAKEIYRELDQVWRTLEGQSRKIKPIVSEDAGLTTLTDRLRGRLQDDTVWGEAAKSHRALTESHAALRAAQDEVNAFLPSVAGKTDRSAVERFTRELDRVTGDTKVAALARYVDAHNGLAKTASETLADLPVGSEGRKLVAEYGGVYKRLSEDVMTLNAQDRLLAQNRAAGVAPTWLLGAGLAGLGLGPAGAGMAVGNLLLNPGRTARQIAAMAAFKTQVADHIGGRLAKLVGAEGRITKALPVQTPKAVQLMISGTPKERAEAFEEHMQEMAAVAEPTNYVAHVAPQLNSLASAMPEHAQAMTIQGQKIMAFLATEAPKPLSTHTPSAPGHLLDLIRSGREKARRAAQPSDADIRAYGQLVEVAVSGAPAVLTHMEKGTLRASHVRALKTLYPHQAADMTRQMMELVPKATKPMSPSAQRSVQLFLGGEAQPRATTAFQQSLYQQEAAQAQQSAASAGAGPNAQVQTLKVIGPLSTPTDRSTNFPFPSQ